MGRKKLSPELKKTQIRFCVETWKVKTISIELCQEIALKAIDKFIKQHKN